VECPYFDEEDYVCLAPEVEKRRIRTTKNIEAEPVEVDPETFLFEDDEEEVSAGRIMEDYELDDFESEGLDEDDDLGW